MFKPTTGCLIVLLSGHSALANTDCPQETSDVAVKVARFSGYPPAYVFMVTNNGTNPISTLDVGSTFGSTQGDFGWDKLIEVSEESVPMSMGSPGGWNGQPVPGQDPRLPQAHSFSLTSYLWVSDDPESWIQPGQSLSGFSVQLPGSGNEMDDGGRHPNYPDLTDVPFVIRAEGPLCHVVGMVEPDLASKAGSVSDMQSAPKQPIHKDK